MAESIPAVFNGQLFTSYELGMANIRSNRYGCFDIAISYRVRIGGINFPICDRP